MSGKIDIDDLKKDINKRAGEQLAYNLNEEDPTEINFWMSTGCTMLDSIISQDMVSGIPSGKIVELAGEQSVGKSFLCSLIASNAQKTGDVNLVVYFDAEEAQDSTFLERAGADLSNLLYIQAKSVEFVFGTIEQIIADYDNVLFIWDSIAMTALEGQKEEDFGQRNDVAGKGRVLSHAFKKVTIPLGNSSSTLLCTNQLRDYIPKPSDPPSIQYTKPTYTPGGRTAKHAYSLRIWLKRRDAQNAYVEGEDGQKIGAEVRAEIEKSRFGSEERECEFDIIWGDGVHIEEKPYWVDALKNSEHFKTNGAWHYFEKDDVKFKGQGSDNFLQEMECNPGYEEKVREAVIDALVEEGDIGNSDVEEGE